MNVIVVIEKDKCNNPRVYGNFKECCDNEPEISYFKYKGFNFPFSVGYNMIVSKCEVKRGGRKKQ